MRKKSLLITATTAIIYLTVSSYSSGPAHNMEGDKTGRPGRTSCTDCHGGGSGTTTGSIEIRRKDWGSGSPALSSYIAGQTYIVTLTGANITPGLDDFGFQLTAIKSSDNTPVGTYGSFGSQVHGFPTSNPTIVEHSSPIAKTGGNYMVSFDWTAPSAGVGEIKLYGIINAVNDNDSVTGDVPSSTLVLTLADATSVAKVTSEVVVKAYPNPVADVLTIDLDKADAGMYTVQVYSISGSMVNATELNIGPGNYKGTVATSDWAPGMYFVRIQKDGYKHMMPIVKQ